MHVRLSSTDTNGALSIMDITAPAGPGTPRHLHHREHEVLRIVSGQIVVWTPERSFAIGPGELASLPKGVPHAWRPYGGQPVKFILNCFPGGFEHIFPTIIERGITLEDVAELSQVAKEFGIDIVGPTLSDEEVESILRGANV
jgi:mannose-6-phosphate isomerase-like protein (cupin superfamily)